MDELEAIHNELVNHLHSRFQLCSEGTWSFYKDQTHHEAPGIIRGIYPQGNAANNVICKVEFHFQSCDRFPNLFSVAFSWPMGFPIHFSPPAQKE
jgi:hypothetical protein